MIATYCSVKTECYRRRHACILSGLLRCPRVSANTIKMTMASERSAPPDNSKKLFIAARRVAGRNKCAGELSAQDGVPIQPRRGPSQGTSDVPVGPSVGSSLGRPSGLHSMHANEAGDCVSRQARRHDCGMREFRGRRSRWTTRPHTSTSSTTTTTTTTSSCFASSCRSP